MLSRLFQRNKKDELTPLLDKAKNKSTVSFASLPIELKHIIRDYLAHADNPQQLDIVYPHSMSQDPFKYSEDASKAIYTPNYEDKEEGSVSKSCVDLTCTNPKTVLRLSALALKACGLFVDGANYVKERYECHSDKKEIESILPQRQKMV